MCTYLLFEVNKYTFKNGVYTLRLHFLSPSPFSFMQTKCFMLEISLNYNSKSMSLKIKFWLIVFIFIFIHFRWTGVFSSFEVFIFACDACPNFFYYISSYHAFTLFYLSYSLHFIVQFAQSLQIICIHIWTNNNRGSNKSAGYMRRRFFFCTRYLFNFQFIFFLTIFIICHWKFRRKLKINDNQYMPVNG